MFFFQKDLADLDIAKKSRSLSQIILKDHDEPIYS